MQESIALAKTKQTRFNRKMKNVKDKVKRGFIKIKTNAKKLTQRQDRGLVYIGHVPHGFYEQQMRRYFKQFGKVTNVRVCRSKKNGRSKGYAFVEFAETGVAEIVAETMNNYLMYNRRLIAKYIPPENQRRNLFAGVPWSITNFPLKSSREAQIAKKNKMLSEFEYRSRIQRQMDILQKKVKKLADLGIKHDFKPTGVPDDSKILLLNDSNLDNSYEQDPYDSDIEIKVKQKHTEGKRNGAIKKSLKSITKIKDKLSEKNNVKYRISKNEKLLKLATSQVGNDFIVENLTDVKKLAGKPKRTFKK